MSTVAHAVHDCNTVRCTADFSHHAVQYRINARINSDAALQHARCAIKASKAFTAPISDVDEAVIQELQAFVDECERPPEPDQSRSIFWKKNTLSFS